MLIDPITLLLSLSISSAALCVVLSTAWMGSRRDTFLIDWSVGLACAVLGIVLIKMIAENYNPGLQAVSFIALIVGFGFIYSGSIRFTLGQPQWTTVWAVTGLGVLLVIGPFALGFSGLGTMTANLAIAVLLVLTGWQYWKVRSEAPTAMTATAALYVITAVSFALCSLAIVLERQWVLTEPPTNWAESINTIVLLVGVSGIGALSLSANQARISRFHQIEAQTDPLTKLLNRRALSDRSTFPVRPRTAAVLFDLDHFKSVNDNFGHAAGDLVLCHFAETISDGIRISDIAARVGGEEFCVILHNVDREMAVQLAERIRKRTEEKTVRSDKGMIAVTVSVGVAYSEGGGESFDSLFERTDQALYAAKTDGRNRVISDVVKQVA